METVVARFVIVAAQVTATISPFRRYSGINRILTNAFGSPLMLLVIHED